MNDVAVQISLGPKDDHMLIETTTGGLQMVNTTPVTRVIPDGDTLHVRLRDPRANTSGSAEDKE